MSDSQMLEDSETLALIAEHRLHLTPFRNEEGAPVWCASNGRLDSAGEGPTIGDAVRACVQKIKGEP